VVPGETIYYRVRLDFGQRAAFTVDAPAPGSRYAVGGTEAVYLDTYAYAPDRAPIGAVTGMHTMLSRTRQSAVMGQSGSPRPTGTKSAKSALPDRSPSSPRDRTGGRPP